jgi:hypothetical protein
MATNNFTRNLSAGLIYKLKSEPLFSENLKKDCADGKVFPTIRNELIDFYHKGGRLFQYNNKGFKTHIKYAAVIPKSKDDYLTENEFNLPPIKIDFLNNYVRIKENCANYSGIEALGVAEIYHKYSCINSNSEVVVLDIEVSFKSLEENSAQDRIDILMFNKKEQKLKFVEAKHYSNPEIWSKSIPKVINQVLTYQGQIKNKQIEIISAYNNYIYILNKLFSIVLPSVNSVDDKVTLLVFGYDSDQEKGKLAELITGKVPGNKKITPFNNKGITLYTRGNIQEIVLNNLWKAK